LIKSAAQEFFNLIHHNRLVYNACWEDPKIDRQLINLDPTSKLVVITSAGCNVLDYLLDSPEEIHAVDVNDRQNALLELKLALLARGDFHALFSLFGLGGCEDYQKIYHSVRDLLSPPAQEFWDKKINYFSGRGLRKSFYWRGAAGDFAWLFRLILLGKANSGQAAINAFLNSATLEAQKRHYQPLEKGLWSKPVSWLIRQPWCLALVGVPKAQINLLSQTHPQGLTGFVQEKLRHVMTRIPISDNYFWRVYLTGSYTKECCPNYLKEENFKKLKSNINKVKLHSCTITDFLKSHPGTYTHFILLDHQDWLACHQPQTLAEEWDAIFQNSSPGAKVLMRSAGINLDFLPDMVKSRLQFFPDLTTSLHHRDRVGTYGSLHFAEVM
jgi:S-adenosylmethionine-diacylglycerol 3-amino-3-carboxypropyl transferase